jgi:hypothetical protein
MRLLPRLLVLILVSTSAAIAHADPVTELPEQPTRPDVQASMHAVAPAIAACAGGAHGMATLSYEFGNDGRVRSVVVRDGHVGGAPITAAVERCIVAAARSAVLPPFRRETIVINYPYRL